MLAYEVTRINVQPKNLVNFIFLQKIISVHSWCHYSSKQTKRRIFLLQRSEKIYIKAWDWLDPSFDVWRPPQRWWCSSKSWDENWISFTRKWPQRPDTFNREWLRRKFKGNKLRLCYLARSNIGKLKRQSLVQCSKALKKANLVT